MAERYYSISPYVYVANNPLKYIDPNGKRVRPARIRPNPRQNRGATRYNANYTNGVRPPSIVRSNIKTFLPGSSNNIKPVLVEFTTPNFNTVQILNGNVRAQKLTLQIDLTGVIIQEIQNKFTINTEFGPIEKSSTEIKLSDSKLQAEYNEKQLEYETKFSSELININNETKEKNNGTLSFLDYLTNINIIRNNIGESLFSQIKNWIKENKDNFEQAKTSEESIIPEIRKY